MEKMKVVGKQKLDFTGRDGNPVKGIKLHCLCTKTNVDGDAVETVFCNERSEMIEVAREVPINGEIEVTFNRWGKPDSVFFNKAAAGSKP